MKYISLLILLFYYWPFANLTSSTDFIPEEGLIAYYSFNHCDARDDTGGGSDGQLFGDIGCWCGIDDDGLLLDGRRDYIEFTGKVNQYFNTSDFSLSFYFKPEQYQIFAQSLISKRAECDEYNMLDILLNMGQKIIETEVHENPNKDYRDISPNWKESGWHHYALVREGTMAYTYIDGALQARGMRCSGVDIGNDALLSFSNSPCIGSGGARRFKGILDELCIYDRALTEEEVGDLYNLYPIENAASDCFSYLPKKSPSELYNTEQSPYLCLSFE
ncbi:MAG: LamG domain-containing protein [Bacteroidota bacterium]